MVVVALFVLEPVQRFINNLHKVKDYRIKTNGDGSVFKNDLDDFLKSTGASFRCMKVVKEDNDAVYTYRIGTPNRNYDAVNNYLLMNTGVQSFDF
jgi:putative Mg2+ transporter-C (MgtC) family protein